MNDFRTQPPAAPTLSGPWDKPFPQPAVADPATSEAQERAPVLFTENSSSFLRLIIHGAWLQFFTFGFYRFWLTTDVRRHLWSHTIVNGEGAEYTGTARELLYGFLFALAVLMPVYLVYFLAGVEAERYQAFASIPLGVILLLFAQFAVYRARRYRLSRTIWRGVRFWMSGSGWKYAFLSFGWLLLVILTLGLLYPWRVAVLERYKMRHTYYGNIQGNFTASGWDFFKKGIWLWLLALLPVALVIASLIQIGLTATSGIITPNRVIAVSSLGGLGLLIWPMLWPFLKAFEWRWWASGVKLGSVRIASTIRVGQLYMLYISFLIAAFLFAIVFAMAFGILYAVAEAISRGIFDTRMADFAGAMMRWSPYAGIVSAVIVYLIAGLAFGVVQRYFLQYRYWAMLCGSLMIENIENLDGALAEGELAGALGEGLADGLDVGGF